MKKLTSVLLLALSLTACKYSNTFEGTYNGNPASMTAYSKNINRYCVALNMKSGSETKSTYISAQDVFDSNDFLKPMSFNTKNANCGSDNEEYLVGNRKTTVLGESLVTFQSSVNVNYCQQVTYKRYEYKEDVTFEFKKKSNDELTGTFSGIGLIDYFTDTNHPVAYGPIYFCGNGYPGGYPYPGPGFPYPRPFPPYPPYPYFR